MAAVAFAVPRFHTNQLGWVEALSNADHPVSIYVEKIGHSEDHSRVQPIVLTSRDDGPLRTLWTFPGSVLRRRNVLRHDGVRCLVVRAGSNRWTFEWILGALAAGVRPVIYTQGSVFARADERHRRLLTVLVSRVARIRWISPVLTRDPFDRRYALATEMRFVPFSVVDSPRQPRQQTRSGHVSFITVGKFHERKGLIEVVRAFGDVAKEYPGCHLTVVGECLTEEEVVYRTRVMEEVDRTDTNRVQVMTNLSVEDLRVLMGKQDILVLNAVRESASISQLEAMAEGLAVICSNDNGTASYVRQGVNGFIIRPVHDELVQAMRLLLHDSHLLRTLKSRSRAIYEQTYSPTAVLTTLLRSLGLKEETREKC